jgi:HAMP domain-containing protein
MKSNISGGIGMGTIAGTSIAAGAAALMLAFNPVTAGFVALGAGIVAFTGLFTKSQLEISKRDALIVKSAQEFARGMYDATREIQGIQKFLLDIDKKTDKEVFERTSSGVKVLVSSTNNLINAQNTAAQVFGGLSKIPKETQSNFDLLAQSTQRLTQEFDKLIGAAQQRAAQEIGRQVVSGNYNTAKLITDFTDAQRQNLRSRAESEYRGRFEPQIADLRIAGFNKEADKAELQMLDMIDLATEKAANEFSLGLSEAARQSLLMKEALLKEKILREKLLGTLAKQIAIETALTNFEYALNRAAASVDCSLPEAFSPDF